MRHSPASLFLSRIPCVGLSAGVLFAVLAGGGGAAVAEGDPDGSENRAAEGLLPHGKGLAADYSGDAEIENHAAVIFADNFESGELPGKWEEARNKDTVLRFAEMSDGPVGKRSLEVEAHLGKDTGGGLTTWFEPAPTVFIRFYARFGKDCDYVHHFVTLRANKSLQGGEKWSGFGGAGKKPQGDERFSTALEPWGNWGRNPAPGKWNFYSYWHEMSPSPDKKYWGNAFRAAEQPGIEKEQWICCEFMLKENTPGKPNGEQAYWIDGKLRGHWKGINWRTSPTLHANALTLEAYITDRWTKNPVNTVYFDNVVIAKEYVGPSGE